MKRKRHLLPVKSFPLCAAALFQGCKGIALLHPGDPIGDTERFVMPFPVGLMNIVEPQQIGARDVAFPYMNWVSLWLTTAGALLVMVSNIQHITTPYQLYKMR
jgi:hypothetical protein